MITNFKNNCMGTVSFDGKFQGMRKAQDFIVYPMQNGDPSNIIKVQSDTRIGMIRLTDGAVVMSPPRKGGAYSPQMATAKRIDTLGAEELLMLKAALVASASPKAGSNGVVYVDNSGAGQALAI